MQFLGHRSLKERTSRSSISCSQDLVSWSEEEARRMRPACILLLQAYGYSCELGRDVWDFAVEIQALRDSGLNSNDFRWLILKGYVEHAHEMTSEKKGDRDFCSASKLTFTDSSCFVLTEAGAGFVHEVAGKLDNMPILSLAASPPVNSQVKTPEHPDWDPDRRALRLHGLVVKRFKRRAPNQELILAAFQELGWPPRMDDPLPPAAEKDPKRRLHDTINSLNRHQKQPLMRFAGDGSGKGICWEFISASRRTE